MPQGVGDVPPKFVLETAYRKDNVLACQSEPPLTCYFQYAGYGTRVKYKKRNLLGQMASNI